MKNLLKNTGYGALLALSQFGCSHDVKKQTSTVSYGVNYGKESIFGVAKNTMPDIFEDTCRVSGEVDRQPSPGWKTMTLPTKIGAVTVCFNDANANDVPDTTEHMHMMFTDNANSTSDHHRLVLQAQENGKTAGYVTDYSTRTEISGAKEGLQILASHMMTLTR